LVRNERQKHFARRRLSLVRDDACKGKGEGAYILSKERRSLHSHKIYHECCAKAKNVPPLELHWLFEIGERISLTSNPYMSIGKGR
jgi:hypothetical protein